MNRFFKRLETTMAAAAFAEAGDHETCREIMSSRERVRPRDRVEARPETPRPRPQLRAPSPRD